MKSSPVKNFLYGMNYPGNQMEFEDMFRTDQDYIDFLRLSDPGHPHAGCQFLPGQPLFMCKGRTNPK